MDNDNFEFPQKKYKRFKRNHVKRIWEFDGFENIDYGMTAPSNKEYNYVLVEEQTKTDSDLQFSSITINNSQIGNFNSGMVGKLNQESESSESPLNHNATTTPSMKQRAHKKIVWYKSTLFKSFIWPVITGLVIYLIIHYF